MRRPGVGACRRSGFRGVGGAVAAAVAPGAPTISGTVTTGGTLTIAAGTPAGTAPVTYTLYRDGVSAGAVTDGYTFTANDVGPLALTVKASNAAGTSAASNALTWGGVAALSPDLLYDERGQTGSPISQIDDQSAGGTYDATQPTGGKQPAASTVNSLASPDYSAASAQWMAAASGTGWPGITGSATDFSLVFAIDNTGKTPGADSATVYTQPAITSSSDGSGLGLMWSLTGPQAYVYDGAYKKTNRLTAAVGRHILHVKLVGGTLSISLDGGPEDTVACGAMVGGGGGGIVARFGANWNAAIGFDGKMPCVFARGPSLTTDEAEDLIAFLAWKYAVQLGA
jgi:hypothetical protein